MASESLHQLPLVTEAASEWPADPSLYQLLGKIGQGAFATVWKARRTIKNEQGEDMILDDCAIKVLNLDHADTNLAEIRLEVQAMRLLSHPNVLTCHTAFVNDRNLWLVTPLMRKGSSLHSLQAARRALRKQATTTGTASSVPVQLVNMEQHILYIMHETLLGLQYIHENGQIHRDIKAGNILLDGNGDVRIADFGVSGFLVQGGSQQEKAKTFVGTPCWMAPEVMEQVHGYDYKADIWSLGITALELAKGYAPYAKYPPMKVLILTIQEAPPSLASYDVETGDSEDEVTDEYYSSEFEAFVALCLQKNPARRPTCPELLASRHFCDFSEMRQARREAMRDEVCALVKDVGSKQEEAARSSLPGNTPVSIVLSEAEDRAAGTTWVFADGSQVMSSSSKRLDDEDDDDVMAELDEFERQTGGEHYDRNVVSSEHYDRHVVTDIHNNDDSQNADDLDQFMDEFEQNTAGEDFRHSHPNL